MVFDFGWFQFAYPQTFAYHSLILSYLLTIYSFIMSGNSSSNRPASVTRSESKMLDYDDQPCFDSDDESKSPKRPRQSMSANPLQGIAISASKFNDSNRKRRQDNDDDEEFIDDGNDDIENKPHKSTPSPYQKTKANKRGKVSKNKKLINYFSAVIQNQQLHKLPADRVTQNCMQGLKSSSSDELSQLLTDIIKMEKDVIETNQTFALNIISNSAGGEKDYYDSLEQMSGPELQNELNDFEGKMNELNRMNEVVKHMINEKSSNKDALSVLKKCILKTLADNN